MLGVLAVVALLVTLYWWLGLVADDETHAAVRHTLIALLMAVHE